jgi:hypothetical protein
MMGSDRLEKGVRLGQAKQESDQMSMAGFQVFSKRDQFVEDPLCFVVAKFHFSSEFETRFDR